MQYKNLSHTIYVFIACYCGLMVAGSANAQQVSVKAKLDTMAMSIGQQQTFHLEASHPKGLVLEFPEFGQNIIDKIEIVEALPTDTVDHGNRLTISKDYIITSYDSGFYYFDPIVVKIDSLHGGGTLETDPLVLRVITFQVDESKGIFDIKAPMPLKFQFRELLPWMLGSGVLLILIFLVIYLIIRIQRKKPVIQLIKPKPVEPPHVIALRELQKLKDEKLWHTERVKTFYTQLTDVLRVYIEGRYGIRAMEETSDDIIRNMRFQLTDKDAAMRNLVQILQTADLVKFAKMKPLPNENDLCMMNAILFVEQTRPVEVVPVEETRKRMEEENAKKNEN